MGINAVWRAEDGSELGAVLDPQMLLSRFATRRAQSVTGSVCLAFLDPIGNTCFNQRQIPILAQELRIARATVSDSALAKHLDQVTDLVDRAIKVHTYLWFEGD